MQVGPSPSPIIINGRGGPTDWVSLVLALGAFVVAVLALYLSNLKRAEIIVDVAPDQTPRIELETGVGVGGGKSWPTAVRLVLPIVAFNTGARTGVLTKIGLREFEDRPDPLLFLTEMPRPLMDINEAFEAGQLRVYVPNLHLELDLPGDPNFPELEGRLLGRSVRVLLSYRFLRGRSVLPRRRRNILQERSLWIDVSLEPLVSNLGLGK
jgi:hypothetical protein